MKNYKQTQKDKDFFSKIVKQLEDKGFSKPIPDTGRDDATTP